MKNFCIYSPCTTRCDVSKSSLFYRGLPVSSLLNDMPYCLHAEVCYALIGDIVKEIPMFRSCGMPFRRLLCTKAQFCHFYPGEYVMNDGDIGQGMYIVRRGKVGNFFYLFLVIPHVVGYIANMSLLYIEPLSICLLTTLNNTT